ncbi:MAG: hypothetical protein QNJ12_22205, partial [Ilumatobacter sp.]|nr:hypothetical protein [Ilumatobacter sp.]
MHPATSLRARWAAIGAAVAVTVGAGIAATDVVDATVSSGERTVLVAITPCRLFDTRPEFQVGPKSTPLGANETVTLNGRGAVGNCSLPDDATALSLNVTAVGATLPTFLTIWPTGATMPTASSLNPFPDSPPAPNAVTVDLSDDGRFDVYNLQGQVHVLADVVGYYVHHTHDDLYDTRAQVDAELAGLRAEIAAVQAEFDGLEAEVDVLEAKLANVSITEIDGHP